jgi:hypothetical protein
MFTRPRTKLVAAAAVTVFVGASLAACSSGNESTPSTGSEPQTQPSLGGNFQEVQQCLDAAGIKLKLPSGAPTDVAGGTPPSGAPTGTPPSFDPGQAPQGGPGAGLFNNPRVQRALKACGIQVPTAP